jgi:hypothetical protein
MILGLVLQSITGFALSGAYEPLTKNNTIAGFAVSASSPQKATFTLD